MHFVTSLLQDYLPWRAGRRVAGMDSPGEHAAWPMVAVNVYAASAAARLALRLPKADGQTQPTPQHALEERVVEFSRIVSGRRRQPSAGALPSARPEAGRAGRGCEKEHSVVLCFFQCITDWNRQPCFHSPGSGSSSSSSSSLAGLKPSLIWSQDGKGPAWKAIMFLAACDSVTRLGKSAAASLLKFS